jgi:hypothetical protein
MCLLNGRKLLAKAAENWPAKALAIALAIILFVFHRMSTLKDRFFSVPLSIESNGDLIPAGPYPRTVRVRLRGDADSIDPIQEEDVEAYLDLTKYTQEGTYRSPVQVRKNGTALGVEPLEIRVDPMEVSVELDQKIGKSVPLTPNLRGYIESGYELVSYSLSPTQVAVEGPLKIIDGLEELATDFIDLEGRRDDFSVSVRILNRDPLVVIRGDGMADFQGFVKELIIIRNFEDLPITVTGLDEGFTAEPAVNRGSIRVEGTQSRFDQEPELSLTLDCSAVVTGGTYTLPVTALIPPELTLVRKEPEEIQVRITDSGGEP